MSDSLTPQQQLLLDQQWRMLDARNQAGDHLDNKASIILQSGSLIIALVGVVALPSVIAQQAPTVQLVGLAFALLMFAGMIMCALLAWRPSDFSIPGATDWDAMYNDYVNETLANAYAQVLSNIMNTTDKHAQRNRVKAKYVTWGAWLLVLQVAGILVIAVASAL